MALLADHGRMIFSETNYDAPAGLKITSCQDLALYPELGRPGRGVLVVTVIGSVKFIDGVATTGGAALTWTPAEKASFLTDVPVAVADVWNDKHRITTTSTVPSFNDVGMMFDLQLAESMSVLSHSHWNVIVTKSDKWTVSCVDRNWSTWITNGETHLDSLDLRAENKGGPGTQRDCVHEFGHMLGYRDEYPVAKSNLDWLGQPESAMHFCEEVKPRHYAFYADWLTKQFRVAASLAKEPIEWKVNGLIDLTLAHT